MTTKKFVSFAIKILALVAAFFFIFYPEKLGLDEGLFGGIKPIDVWEQLRAAGQYSMPLLIFWLSMAVVVKLGGIFSGIIRWKLLLKGQNIYLPFWYMAYLWFMGRFVGLFLPGTLGLDGWRLVESARYTNEWVKCTTVIAIEKLIGFIALTLLLFVTFPLGFAILNINIVVFAGIMLFLFTFVATCFILLFNPKIIQVVVTVLPVPGKIRNVVNQIGVAATAYSGQKGTLLLAVFFGVLVHLGTVIMHFFTMLAIRAENTSIFDILFAAPITIYASVITPAISGMGVREIIFGQLLGGTSGFDAAVTFGHLGLWTGEVIPLFLSVPLLLMGGQFTRARLKAEFEELKAHRGLLSGGIALTAEEVRHYTVSFYGALIAATVGGLFAGATIGLLESLWIWNTLGGLTEMSMFRWGPIVYSLIYAGVGLGVAAGLLFLYMLFDRFPHWSATFALGFGGSFLAGGMIIGLFRFQRDVLMGHSATSGQLILLLAVIGGLTLIGMTKCFVFARKVHLLSASSMKNVAASGIAAFGILIAAGFLFGMIFKPAPEPSTFSPARQADGPNIILVVIDTLRADYLKLYDPAARAVTPRIEAFAEDAVLYDKGFSQASWTKASFGTIWTGMYPECHTAVTKTASLPQAVETVSELLLEGGYYTQGFSNNPNITSIFGYGQGYVNYVDLKPSHLFGAGDSAARLSMYEVLRLVREKVKDKLPDRLAFLKRIGIDEYYQPGDAVRAIAHDWLDNNDVPEGVPFKLFVHFMDPHDPYRAPEDPTGGYGRKRLGENPDPEIFKERFQDAYIGEIEFLDEQLGLFFDGLKARGLYDDSLIIVTADHGEEFCEHGGWWHGQTLYEEQIRVPMLIKLPGNERGGERNIFLARNLDLAPTMLHFANLPIGEMMQGQSLFDAENRHTNATIGYSYAENNFEGIVLQSVRTVDSKLILANEGNKRELEAREFYDVGNDPLEQVNLSGENSFAAIEAELFEAIDQYLLICEEGAVEPEAVTDMSPELLDQLESLGYLGDF